MYVVPTWSGRACCTEQTFCNLVYSHHCSEILCRRLPKTLVDDNLLESHKKRSWMISRAFLQLKFSVTLSVGNVYQRCIVSNVLYFSKCYTRTQKRNSYTVCFRYEEEIQFGEIQYFLCVSVSDSFKVYAYVTQLLRRTTNKRHFELPHSALDSGVSRIFSVSAGQMVLVPVQFLICKCVSC